MGTIKLLSAALSDQIAAGEVVERPSSVAKELLENALDAGATRITIDFDDGGVRRLRIVDNGIGMSPDDALLSIRRHATSKIQNVEDLNQIGTLGFRGEALASIASVSRFSLRTKMEGALAATKIEVVGGEVATPSECGGPTGTEILVSDLFFNVPARRKFLKKPQTESAHIVETAQRLAICYPKVSIKVIRDGKIVLDLPIHRSLEERLEMLFPSSLVKKLEPLHIPGAFGLSGVIGPPEEGRGSTRHYYLFINGRIVKDRVLMSAIQGGCGHRLSKGKHPFAVVSLSLPAQAVDVNVHPAKTEVRFADSREVYRLVARAVEGALTRPKELPVITPQGGSISGLAIKRVVDASALTSTVPKNLDQESPAQTDSNEGAIAAQKRRVFDAMARLAQQQTRSPERKKNVNTPMPSSQPSPARASEMSRPLKPTSGPTLTSVMETPKSEKSSQPAALTEIQSGLVSSAAQNNSPKVSSLSIDSILTAECLTNLKPALRHLGLLFFKACDGAIVVDLCQLQRTLLRHRIREGAFAWAPWQTPITKKLSSGERTQRVVEVLARVGVQSEPFGPSTIRLLAHDESLDPEECASVIEGLTMEALLDARQMERVLLDIAQNSKLEAWQTILGDPDLEQALDAAVTRLKSSL